MIPDEKLTEDLEHVVEKLGKVPTQKEYKEYGQYSINPFIRHFGDESWLTALETLGYDVSERKEFIREQITEEQARKDIRRVANKVGHPPLVREYDTLGNYYYQTIAHRFGDGSWTAALQYFGYEIPPNRVYGEKATTDKELKRDLRGLTITLGRTPQKKEYKQYGKWSAQNLVNRLGSEENTTWNSVLEELGYNTNRITKEKIIEDLHRVDNKTTGLLSTNDYNKYGKHTSTTVVDVLDQSGWTSALKEARLFDPEDHPYSPK